jgi:hypothetical protein
MYSDILYFGYNSVTKPENITALMVAVDQEEGDEAIRLHAEAIANFERKRVEIVNPALESPPRAMELKRPRAPLPELEGLTFDVDDLDLIEAAPASSMPVSAKAIVAPSSAKWRGRALGSPSDLE